MKALFIKKPNGLAPSDDSSRGMLDKIPNGSLIKVSWQNGRTINQNALSHMWYTDIAKHFKDRGKTHFDSGDKMNDSNMKDNLKMTYLGCEEKTYIDMKTGEVITTTELRHTSDLEKGDMTNYLMLIDAFCAQYKIYIRKPMDSEYVQIMKEIGEMA